MIFETELSEGIFLRRYQRFFADIQAGSEVIKAHVPNTGSLRTCAEPGSPCWFSRSDDPKRKLKATLQAIQAPSGAWVGVNTALPNKIVGEGLAAAAFPHWQGLTDIRAEFAVSPKTRFDFHAVGADGRQHFIEVKNVSMAEEGVALFPDAPTERGRKHLRELMALAAQGHAAELVFTIQRDDVKNFAAADRIDSEYGDLLRQAAVAGVRITPAFVAVDRRGAALSGRLATPLFQQRHDASGG